MNDGTLPPPFVVGQKYFDRNGEYTVTATVEHQVTLQPKTGRSVFANDGDWAKAEMTAERLHEVVDRKVHWEGGTRRECNVYRITPRGLDQLRKRG